MAPEALGGAIAVKSRVEKAVAEIVRYSVRPCTFPGHSRDEFVILGLDELTEEADMPRNPAQPRIRNISPSLRSPLPAMYLRGERKFFALILLLFLVAAPAWASDRSAAETPPQTSTGAAPTFVGSATCGQCHKTEQSDWQGSHHAVAMQAASEASVLGRFDGATFEKDGVKSQFFKRDGKFWVHTDGPDGKLADFEIAYTFGVAPLQQYLIALPAGRLQALGIAWDARPASDGGQRWFHLYPDRKLVAGDPLHWTGIDQNWNYQCAWCHSTNLQKNYDSASRAFHTHWSEISVGCEACHGPASNHIAWAGKDPNSRDSTHGFAWTFDERAKASWPMAESGQAVRSTPRATNKEIEVCAGCHSRRQQFSSNAQSVARYFDAFRPSLLESGLYYDDGQQREEVYNYASFLQSKMYGAGVTCSDCHNPHSGKLKLAGNEVCSQCHSAARFDQQSHHHHASGSTAQCVNCHMPTTTYMGVHARHDHSMRIPRPDRTEAIATPNACSQCHGEKNAAWAADAIRSWRAAPSPGAQGFAEAFALADKNGPGDRAALMRIAEDKAQSSIARASALERLARIPNQVALDLAAALLANDDASVRRSAVAVIANGDAATRRERLAPLLHDSTRLVRMEAARALAGEAEADMSAGDRDAFAAALVEYVSAQLFNAERPEAHENLGSLYVERGKPEDARTEFRKAIEIDPTFHPATISLAELTRAGGDESGAEAILRKALGSNPRSGALVHSLGLSLIRQKRIPEALEKLTQATEFEPAEPRFAYVLAVALHDTGQAPKAIDTLKALLEKHPNDRNALMALVSYEMEAGDRTSAASRARLLSRLEPDSDDVKQMLGDIESALKHAP